MSIVTIDVIITPFLWRGVGQVSHDAALSLLKMSPFPLGVTVLSYGQTDGRFNGRTASNAYGDLRTSQVRKKTVTQAKPQ